jgi:L-cystine uptake protein TcyP (sodium:dicarboxylate symporter family)
VIILGLSFLLFIVGLIGLFITQKNHWKFSTRVFIGLGAGLVLGLITRLGLGAGTSNNATFADWTGIVADGYVALLQMLVVPLVFISIVGAFTKIQESGKLGKIAGTVLATLLSTTAISALFGYLSVIVFHLDGAKFAKGAAETARIAELATKQESLEGLTIPQQIVNVIPRNVFADFAGTRPPSTLGVVIFAIFVGVAYVGVKRKHPDEALTFGKWVDALHAIIMRITTLVLRLTPYGIFALILRVVLTTDVEAMLNLITFILASYSALIAVLLMHLLILAIFKVSPVNYLKKAWPVLTFAFTSRSSAGTLPINVETQTDKFGVDGVTANFATSFGLSIGQNGCAGVYPAMLATIVAPTVGINVFTLQWVVTLVAIVTVSSFGVAGVGGGATFASLVVLGTLNLPVAIAGLVISIEPLIDMARTAINVSDSMVAGIVTSSVVDEIDRDKLAAQA